MQELTEHKQGSGKTALGNFKKEFEKRIRKGWKLVSHCDHTPNIKGGIISAIWEKNEVINFATAPN